MKKQDLIFTIVAVVLILVAALFALLDKITFNMWLASFGSIVAGVSLIRQRLIIAAKNARIATLEHTNKILTEEYYKDLEVDES